MGEATTSLLKAALVQARIHWRKAQANRRHLAGLMDRAPGCDLYVLPETFSTGFLGDVDQPAETLDGETVAWLSAQARRRDAAIAGSMVIAEEQTRYNRFLLAIPEGGLHHYDKSHLFAFGGEDRRYARGNSRVTVEWRGWRIDLQVCYDLRFPVWCRNTSGFHLQLFVANWPAPRIDAWSTLLKARAIENQAYVIGVNRIGEDGHGVSYPGRSSAWDPMGACLVDAGDGEKVATVELTLEWLQEIRERYRFLEDRDRFRLL